MVTNYLLQTYYYLKNHLEYDCVDIPQSDVHTLMLIQEKINIVLDKLIEDKRIVVVPSVDEMNDDQKQAVEKLKEILKEKGREILKKERLEFLLSNNDLDDIYIPKLGEYSKPGENKDE